MNTPGPPCCAAHRVQHTSARAGAASRSALQSIDCELALVSEQQSVTCLYTSQHVCIVKDGASALHQQYWLRSMTTGLRKVMKHDWRAPRASKHMASTYRYEADSLHRHLVLSKRRYLIQGMACRLQPIGRTADRSNSLEACTSVGLAMLCLHK